MYWKVLETQWPADTDTLVFRGHRESDEMDPALFMDPGPAFLTRRTMMKLKPFQWAT